MIIYRAWNENYEIIREAEASVNAAREIVEAMKWRAEMKFH
jgi:hypothetical protein